MNKVVLDTNVVLDLLYFDDAAARPLRQALEDGRVRCLVSDDTLDEWRRVLAYPEFGLDEAHQATLFARYRSLSSRAHVDPVDGLSPPGGMPVQDRMPRCSDPDDQKFLELAAAGGVQALVSKDRAVLRLRRRCAPLFRILTPAEAVRALNPLPAAGT